MNFLPSRLLRDGQRFALLRWEHIVHDGAPYMTKLYLWRTPWQQTCLHWIFQRDRDRDMHDHPRDFVGLVLRGGYLEERPASAVGWAAVDSAGIPFCPTFLTDRRAGQLAYRRAADPHRIVRVDPGTLTLVVWGHKKREWGFHTDFGWVHWRRYLGLSTGSPSVRPTLLERVRGRLGL
jgi:hypothetical protein